MRLAFFGTSDFAVPALKSLAPWVELVVTQPSRQQGRGNQLVPTPVAKAADQLGIAIESPEKARSPEFVEKIESANFDALVVAAYGQILSERLLGAAKRGGINLHGSILPRYRGAAPIARAILNGETETGVTLMQMDKGMDTGDIIAIERLVIGIDETAGELESRLAILAADMAAHWMPRIIQGDYPRLPQDSAAATIAPKLKSEEGAISFDMDAEEAYRRFRAFTPRPGASLQTDRGALKILQCRFSGLTGKPGTMISKGPDGLTVALRQGALRLIQVQPAGKKPISGNDLANGWRLNEGSQL